MHNTDAMAVTGGALGQAWRADSTQVRGCSVQCIWHCRGKLYMGLDGCHCTAAPVS